MIDHRPTKNDSYAFLIAEGVKRGFEVIAEYRVFIPKLQKKKSIDLVWAKRKSESATYQDRESLDYWELVATFEIEGCNVNIKKEFDRHLRHFPYIDRQFSNRQVFHSVVLYTAAFDRSLLKVKDPAALVLERKNAAGESGIHVFSINEPHVLQLLPRKA